MATITAEAKLYTGIRCWCVDKNISAALTSSFSIGNYNRPIQPIDEFVLSSGALVFRAKRTVADVECVASISLTDERYRTYGGGNNVITPGSPRVIDNARNWKMISSVVCDFPTYIEIDVEKLGIPEGTDVILNFEEGWILEDRGRRLPSGAWEYPTAVQGSPSPKQDNFVSFRTPYFGLSFINSAFTMPNNFRYRNRPGASNIFSAFTPVVSAKVTRQGVDDMQSAFSLTTTIGRIVKVPSSLNAISTLTPTALRIQSTESTSNSIISTVECIGNDLRLMAASVSSTTEFASDAMKYKGVVNEVFNSTTSVESAPVKTTSLTQNITATATISLVPTKLRQLASTITAQSSVTLAQIDSPMIINYSVSNTGVPYGVVLSGTVNCKIHWWNGSVTNATTAGTYNAPSTVAGSNYQVAISGTLTGYNGFSSSIARVIRLQSFGTLPLTDISLSCSFAGNVTQLPVKFPSTVTNMSRMFQGSTAGALPAQISGWNTANVTNMSRMFFNCYTVTADIGSWNTSSVTDMSFMFCFAQAFNNNISGWNTGSVTNMTNMFQNAISFNQNINSWNVSNVSNTSYMFQNATSFNQYLFTWNTASLSNMIFMFNGATSFNGGNMESWNITGVTSLKGVFSGASAFNGLVNGWNTANVTDMSQTFQGCSIFNQNLGSWNTGNVTTTANMFDNAASFNQALPTNWIKTRFMNGMFQNASAFNQDIGGWTLYKAGKGASTYSIDMLTMLNGCGMSTANYSKTLIGWCNYQHFNNGGLDEPVFCRLGASGRTYHNTTYSGNYPYTNAVAARAYLVLNTPNVQPGGGKKWTIIGDSLV